MKGFKIPIGLHPLFLPGVIVIVLLVGYTIWKIDRLMEVIVKHLTNN